MSWIQKFIQTACDFFVSIVTSIKMSKNKMFGSGGEVSSSDEAAEAIEYSAAVSVECNAAGVVQCNMTLAVEWNVTADAAFN